MTKFLLSVSILLSYFFVQAEPCQSHSFSNPDQIKFSSDSVLIVTHPSIDFDGRMSTKVGMDAAVRFAKRNKIPVLYLQDDGKNENYFWEDCQPDHWVYSSGGEINVAITPSHVYSVGGHWELCQSQTLHDVLMSWSKQPKRNLTITVFMDAVYMKASLSFQNSDPYYSDLQRFIGIANYSRPGSESFNNKISMIEAMGVIIREDQQLEFLIRNLPRYQRTLPDYRVEIKLNNSRKKILQKGKGPNPPILLFEFIDSALEIYHQ